MKLTQLLPALLAISAVSGAAYAAPNEREHAKSFNNERAKRIEYKRDERRDDEQRRPGLLLARCVPDDLQSCSQQHGRERGGALLNERPGGEVRALLALVGLVFVEVDDVRLDARSHDESTGTHDAEQASDETREGNDLGVAFEVPFVEAEVD